MCFVHTDSLTRLAPVSRPARRAIEAKGGPALAEGHVVDLGRVRLQPARQVDPLLVGFCCDMLRWTLATSTSAT